MKHYQPPLLTTTISHRNQLMFTGSQWPQRTTARRSSRWKAQTQQLTESNEQMAPQAKDAGKSERFLGSVHGGSGWLSMGSA